MIPKAHTYHYEDERQPDGTTIRRAVLDEPDRFRREMLLSSAYQRETELEHELEETRRFIRDLEASANT